MDGFTEGVLDELPDSMNLEDALNNKPKVPDELIKELSELVIRCLYLAHQKRVKLLLMELAVSLSEGIEWLGFKCKKSRVLYINLEIDNASFIDRFDEIYKALKIKPKHKRDIEIWTLRGKAMPLDKLVPKIVRKVEGQGYDAIIIDPIYKVITGDENNASDMGAFSNQLIGFVMKQVQQQYIVIIILKELKVLKEQWIEHQVQECSQEILTHN